MNKQEKNTNKKTKITKPKEIIYSNLSQGLR